MVVLIAESSTQSKIRINDYNNFRMYNVRRVVFDTSLLVSAYAYFCSLPHVLGNFDLVSVFKWLG
jgi:hypothetical protein